jgi:NAD(P)-dependent dehydrogenase (short-subunit alcohol dehydrogenase family)
MLFLMRPIAEQRILITGATSGLGLELAQALAREGATLLLHGRDRGRIEQVTNKIRQETGNDNIQFYCADFASLRQVADLAQQTGSEQSDLQVLVNNAAVGFGKDASKRELSQDGYELRFAVNYLAQVLLTERLLPLLQASAPARIVNIASVGQAPLNFDDLMLERGYSGVTAYRQSKLALIAWSFDLAARVSKVGVTVNALHPASLMPTKMVLEAGWQTMSTVEEGLKATMRLVIGLELDNVSGKYFDGLREARAIKPAYDPKVRQRLGASTQELIERVVPAGSV